ncbi:MAG: hypothetical protein GX815_14835 [Clostridiales bacterium]|nr:hypothetical protein [Clostridiales bacterium]
MKKDKIVLFCNILQNEVTKYSEKNNKYKHVYFDFAKETLLSFFDENFGVFSVIGDEIFLNKELRDQEIIEINDAYDECIKNALNNTRDIFCNYEEATI